MPLKRTAVLFAIAALFLAPLAVSMAMHPPADAPWYAASRVPTGLAPDPASVREPVIQIFAARAFGWRGGLAVHTWVIVKRTDASAFTRYNVVGWSGPPYVRVKYAAPDAKWYSSRPELLVDRRGEGVEALIDRVETAVKTYPFADTYQTWPGPNGNTFVAHVGRSVPGLHLDLPASAIGKDYVPLASAIGRGPSGTGVQVSLLGMLGLIAAPEKGLEVDVLGLSLGVDVARPALRLPGIGRVGLTESPR